MGLRTGAELRRCAAPAVRRRRAPAFGGCFRRFDESFDSAIRPGDTVDPDVVRDGRLLGRAPVANLTVKSDGAVTIESPVIGDKPAIIAPCKPEVSTPAPRRR
ncbi:hypothetical protein E6W36_01505 [Hankyongella ginsenosidimutans]|uniref:Uncharacterized protein n=1 Tax=Hankyongella ginsenosidimutans TaxID=1763828 RepID=A0A4D7C7V9_9SPHN|nr:hypothetical protein [Hankyongella ginsenosidimutans]QCI78783.1 hypothetical protein E6W36_01505 [Hankyongella ginsenosidimutans]